MAVARRPDAARAGRARGRSNQPPSASHYPSSSWKDVNTCYHTENGQRVYHRSVMNYCYASIGYTRFDSANWSRVYNRLWN